MRYLPTSILVIFTFILTTVSSAQIIEFNKESISMLDTSKLAGITWSSTLSPTNNGLMATSLDENRTHDIWVQTYPFPIGSSWRPPTSASFTVSVEGTINQVAEKYNPTSEMALRYSPDRVNWSTWYRFTQDATDKKFHLSLSLPHAARERYDDLQREWFQTKPVWTSDENEFCKWLIKKEPDFFVAEKPFIGYVQIRFDRFDIQKEQYIAALSVDFTTAVSGMMSPVPDKTKIRKDIGEKWFFVGTTRLSKKPQ